MDCFVGQCVLVTKSSHKGQKTISQTCRGLVHGMSCELEHYMAWKFPSHSEYLKFQLRVKMWGRWLHKVDFEGCVGLE